MKVWPCYAAPAEGAEIANRSEHALQLGVGIARATLTLSRALAQASARPDLVMLFGVAGAFPERHLREPDGGQVSPSLTPGDLCWVSSDRFADLGVDMPDGFVDLAEMGLTREGAFDMDAAVTARLAAATATVCVPACTVAVGAATEARSQAVARRSRARVESMEGAAVAMVCADFGVPMVQVRAISNYTGDRAHGGWALDTACAAVQACVRTAMAALA